MSKSKLFALLPVIIYVLFYGCNTPKVTEKMDIAFEILDDEAFKIFSASAHLEVLDSGFVWTEGPLWLPTTNQLLFNDIPVNKTYSWSENEGTKVYLSPSGHSGTVPREGIPGANGLLLDSDGNLVLCQHGSRQMVKMNAPLDKPISNFTTIIAEYQDKKFSSPNDATFSQRGNLYFTDPPYGLGSPDQQETHFNGVYRYSIDGKLSVIDSTLTRPNGIAFSPDEKDLYVANSDPKNAIWVKYSIDDVSGSVSKKEEFYNSTENVAKEKGLPDGLKINDAGYVFATGPGGVWVFNPSGKVIAKIRTGQSTSNCAFGPNQNILYITADDYIMKATFK